jgi:hypothetical protein
MRYIAFFIVLVITILGTGWIFRIYDKGWIADGRDLATMSFYLWLWFSAILYLVWERAKK